MFDNISIPGILVTLAYACLLIEEDQLTVYESQKKFTAKVMMYGMHATWRTRLP